MKHKQTLAMLLAAAMVLSMPLGAYAQGTPSVPNEQTMIELYGVPDYEAPVLNSISVDKETVKPGETLTFTLNVTDDVSGVNYIKIDLINEATGKTDSIGDSVTVNDNNKYTLTYTVPKDEAVGTLRVDEVSLSDALGRYGFYYSQTNEHADQYLPNEISVKIVESASEDKETPILHDLSLSDTTISAPGKLTLTLNVSDDVSGVDYTLATFINRKTGKEITGSWKKFKGEQPITNGTVDIELATTQYDGSGNYELDSVYLTDENGYQQWYYSKHNENQKPTLPKELSFTVTNESGEDVTAPVLKGISIDKTEVEALSEVTITLDVEDDLSGYKSAVVEVINRKNGRTIHSSKENQDNPKELIVSISEWEPTGLFEVEYVSLFDNNDNMAMYYSANVGHEDELKLPNEVSFLVKNVDENDTSGDVITSTNNSNLVGQIQNMAEGSTAHIYYGNGTTISEDVFEAIKGQDKTIALKSDGIEWIFNGQNVTDENIKDIDLTTSIEAKWNSDSDAAEGIDWEQNALILSFAENGKLPAPAKIRIKADWVFKDAVGTENLYVYYYDNTTKEYVQVAADLTVTQDEYLEFTIDHNSDFVITKGELKKQEEPFYPNPDPDVPPVTPDHKPSRPGSSAGSSANSSANSSNGSGVINYESEKPDPADRQAVKAYNFWQDSKGKLRKTADGKTLRLNVPKEITNMPASVMETLRKENVGLRLTWNGKTITIPAGKAQPKQKLRIYWTMQTLEKLYNA